jgi:hypothetical protein
MFPDSLRGIGLLQYGSIYEQTLHHVPVVTILQTVHAYNRSRPLHPDPAAPSISSSASWRS